MWIVGESETTCHQVAGVTGEHDPPAGPLQTRPHETIGMGPNPDTETYNPAQFMNSRNFANPYDPYAAAQRDLPPHLS